MSVSTIDDRLWIVFCFFSKFNNQQELFLLSDIFLCSPDSLKLQHPDRNINQAQDKK